MSNKPKMNTPNKLTILRMVLTPVFLFVVLLPIPHNYLWGVLAFSIAAVTDAIDGKLARKNNQITVFGKLADPVADKMLTTAALLVFMIDGLCNIWIVFIVLCREFLITSIRLVGTSQGVVIPANIWGKMKTVSQMAFTILIMILMEIDEMGWWPASVSLPLVSNILLSVTAVLAVVSGFTYVKAALKIIDFSK